MACSEKKPSGSEDPSFARNVPPPTLWPAAIGHRMTMEVTVPSQWFCFLLNWTCGLCRDESELSHSNLIRILAEGTALIYGRGSIAMCDPTQQRVEEQRWEASDLCSTHLRLFQGVYTWTVHQLATSLAASRTDDFPFISTSPMVKGPVHSPTWLNSLGLLSTSRKATREERTVRDTDTLGYAVASNFTPTANDS